MPFDDVYTEEAILIDMYITFKRITVDKEKLSGEFQTT